MKIKDIYKYSLRVIGIITLSSFFTMCTNKHVSYENISARNMPCVNYHLADIPDTLTADVIVAGGGTGGFAAALSIAKMGQKVIVTEETDWLGGQLTSQGVPPDENPWIETTGCTSTYRSFRNGVRDYYRSHLPITEKAKALKVFNPGSGGVSKLCHDPRIGVQVLNQMLMPYLLNEQVKILYNTLVIEATTQKNKICELKFRDLNSGNLFVLKAPYFIDATELGDVLPLADVEYVTGAESKEDTGEPHAVDGPAQPLNMQAISHCFVMDYYPGEDHTIEKPQDYDFWVNYVPKMTPAWSGRQLSDSICDNITCKPKKSAVFVKRVNGTIGGLFGFRQIANKNFYAKGFMKSNSTVVNWPMIDYWIKPIFEISPEERYEAISAAKQLSLSYLYWMQTECPRYDGQGKGYPGLKLRKDVFGTADGLAKYPYIRESRRIKGLFRVVEQDISSEYDGNKGKIVADPFFDSVGIGYYRMDLHPSTGGNNYIDLGALPFQIPLGALIPIRLENLIAGSKNISVTHLTNGIYRLHHVEWNIGESAGYLAAFCNNKNVKPKQVREDKQLLKEFQALLKSHGILLEWNPELIKK